jgi:hypothetical protein
MNHARLINRTSLRLNRVRRSAATLLLSMATAWAVLVGLPGAAAASGNTCVYVFGTIDGQTVTTPAVLLFVPESNIIVDPVRVHVDPTSQSIIGYTVKTPGLDQGTEEQLLYVPGVSQQLLPALKTSIDDLVVHEHRCVSFGVTTPAVPIYIPESVLEVPGAVAEVGAIYMNIAGQVDHVVDGHIITFEGNSIIVPGLNAVVPQIPLGTPDATVAVDINGALWIADYLTPQ